MFSASVILNSSLRDGSLTQSANEIGVRTLLYEAGEAMRYNNIAIRAKVMGIINVMRALEMLSAKTLKNDSIAVSLVAGSSRWIRAPESGKCRITVKLGAQVERGDVVGYITEASDGTRYEIRFDNTGVIIGRLEQPMVHEDEAILHLTRFEGDVNDIVNHVKKFSRIIRRKKVIWWLYKNPHSACRRLAV